eukprot:12883582-Alexandrium_andersonii.AAC.1
MSSFGVKPGGRACGDCTAVRRIQLGWFVRASHEHHVRSEHRGRAEAEPRQPQLEGRAAHQGCGMIAHSADSVG